MTEKQEIKAKSLELAILIMGTKNVQREVDGREDDEIPTRYIKQARAIENYIHGEYQA